MNVNIPSYESFLLPVLRAVGTSKDVPFPRVIEQVATDLALPQEALKERFRWSPETVVKARVNHAAKDLAKAGLVAHESSALHITERGTSVLKTAPDHIDRAYLEQFSEYKAYREEFLSRRGA